jgi:2-keto-3-deoxy-galactonokinase
MVIYGNAEKGWSHGQKSRHKERCQEAGDQDIERKKGSEEGKKDVQGLRRAFKPAVLNSVLKGMLSAADGRKEAQYVAVPEHAVRLGVNTVDNDDLGGLRKQP